MWDHLTTEEIARRLTLLETAAKTGGLSGESFSPTDILGLWSYMQGDEQRARAYWDFENIAPDMKPWYVSDIPQEQLDDDFSGFNLLSPPELLLSLWENDPYNEGLAEHPLLPTSAMSSIEAVHEASEQVGLTNENGNPLLLELARNAGLDEQTYEWLWEQVPDEILGEYEWLELAVALVGNPCTPLDRLQSVVPLDQEWLDAFSGPGDDSFREFDEAMTVAYASHPGLPVEQLALLATDITSRVRIAVAKNPRTPHNVLETLATDSNGSVRAAVQRNSHATDEIRALAALGR